MQDSPPRPDMGLAPALADALGPERALKVRTFRLLHHLGQQLRFLADAIYRDDGITAQQAMMLGVVDSLGRPSIKQVAETFATSHQNVKQIATALMRKGFLTLTADKKDARVRRLATTPKNKRYWESRDGDDLERVADWFSPLSQSEVEQLQDLLLKLHRGLTQSVKDVRPQ